MKSRAPESQLRRILGLSREYLTSWFVAGAIITLTGFSPDVWTSAILDGLAIREIFSLRGLQTFDIRIGLVAIGIAIIAWDVLRRNYSRHDALLNDSADIPSPVPQPRLSNGTQRQPQASEIVVSNIPSIVVLPFRNLSGDPKEEYFSDGISDDIITELSRNPWLRVLSRDSGFAFKGSTVDMKQVGLELGVQYVVEGSVRRSDERVRVVAQLVDTETGRHVWAERYDRPIGKLFDLQDEITQAVVGALVPTLGMLNASGLFASRRKASAPGKPTSWAFGTITSRIMRTTKPRRASCSNGRSNSIRNLPTPTPCWHCSTITRSCSAARDHPTRRSPWQSGRPSRLWYWRIRTPSRMSLLHACARCCEITRARSRKLRLPSLFNPNLAVAHYALALALAYAGNGKQAIPSFDRATQLSPNDPSCWSFFHLKSRTLLELRQYEQALSAARSAQRLRPNAFLTYTHSAAALVGLGRLSEACEEIGKARARNPTLAMAFFTSESQRYDVFAFPHFVELLRKAGLPD